jgi:hypothetical protein
MKAHVGAIVQIVVDFYDQHKNQRQSLEDNIQSRIAHNCKRREMLQHSLEESTKQGILSAALLRRAVITSVT